MYQNLLNQKVVIDVSANIIYLGILSLANDHWVELTQVDVHDMNDSQSTKEEYLQNARITLIRPNRQKCRIERNKIVSISLFSEIIR